MKIEGLIRTYHTHPSCVADAISADNLKNMVTVAEEAYVVTTIEGSEIRSVIASLDDYLTNITVADEICSHSKPEKQP